jgi:ABC-2 family transporter protein
MIWLLWRQHRVQVAIAVAVVAGFAVPIWITGVHLANGLRACRSGDTCGGLFEHYNAIDTIVNISVMVPLLIGLFWGATIVGRELEAGTATLVWTQSITRRRWLSTKLLTLFAFTVLCSGAVSALVTWWSDSHNSAVESRFNGLQFDIQNVAPVGYAIFASALGLAAGVLWRRTLPAMATTVGGFVGVRLVVELAARPHYMAPLTKVVPFTKGSFDVPSGSTAVSSDLLLHGHVVQDGRPVGLPCANTTTAEAMGRCMQRLGYQLRTVYQPASRYWTFQWIEFGIFLGLALIMLAVAAVALRRRDA